MTRKQYDELEEMVLESIRVCLGLFNRFSNVDIVKDAAYIARDLSRVLSTCHRVVEDDTAKWVMDNSNELPIVCYCDKCGYATKHFDEFDYCPRCGSKMEEMS